VLGEEAAEAVGWEAAVVWALRANPAPTATHSRTSVNIT
jgi:hypothetical protein